MRLFEVGDANAKGFLRRIPFRRSYYDSVLVILIGSRICAFIDNFFV